MGTGMPMPEWATDDLRSKLRTAIEGADPIASYQVRKLGLMEGYSTLFAEFENREDDVVVHLFPRGGEEDKWWYGYYLPKCRNCGADRTDVHDAKNIPCKRCSHVGLVYIPGRAETKPEKLEFPDTIVDIVEKAVDAFWEGGVAVEMVPELGAVAVQLQKFGTLGEEVKNETTIKILDRIDEGIDASR